MRAVSPGESISLNGRLQPHSPASERRNLHPSVIQTPPKRDMDRRSGLGITAP